MVRHYLTNQRTDFMVILKHLSKAVKVCLFSLFCSRRAVTEHQLMHDRGRSIQSLKRLIWLSSAIERLHTAQTRSLTAGEPDRRWHSHDPAPLYSQPSSSHKRALETLLSNMYRPHLTAALGDGEK
uniref:Parathyroid hormone-like hormone b n=1 Tax=Sinocyclocheilus anshuiensis TaxID=1608454 RepID=A0A671NJK3_9TELE